jgi:hypothetical protein
MGLLADAVLLPPALAVPITGILLALEHAGGWRSTGGDRQAGAHDRSGYRSSLGAAAALNRAAAQVLLVPMAELPTTGIGPTGIAVTLAPLGALPVLVTTVTLAVFKPWAIPTPLTAAISCFVTLRRGRNLVYERNMIDELALRLVHGELPAGS